MGPDRPGEDFNVPSEDLRKAYSEIGEEARYRHKLMHNSYYLSIIALGVFAGTALKQYSQQEFLGLSIVSLLAGGSFLFVATLIYVNNRKRTSAWSYRQELEINLSDHDAWNIQEQVINGRKELVDVDDEGVPKYKTREKNRIESLEAGKIPYIMVIIAIAWFTISAISFGMEIC